jgi:hypothetical protein
VAGDMNARVGDKPIHFLLRTNGEKTFNRSGRKFMKSAAENGLRITNTFFRHKNIRKYTRRNCRSIIDCFGN